MPKLVKNTTRLNTSLIFLIKTKGTSELQPIFSLLKIRRLCQRYNKTKHWLRPFDKAQAKACSSSKNKEWAKYIHSKLEKTVFKLPSLRMPTKWFLTKISIFKKEWKNIIVTFFDRIFFFQTLIFLAEMSKSNKRKKKPRRKKNFFFLDLIKTED